MEVWCNDSLKSLVRFISDECGARKQKRLTDCFVFYLFAFEYAR